MRRFLRPLSSQTPGEKQGLVDGTNLFFGALIGANLGTIDTLPLSEYAFLIVVLAGTVVTLRQFSMSERRRYAYGLLAFYAVFVAWILFVDTEVLETLPDDVRDRLAVTLAIWAGAVVTAELMPTRPVEDQAG